MVGITLEFGNKFADLCQAFIIQPTVAPASFDAETIRSTFIASNELVSAFMGVDEKLYRGWKAFEPLGVQNQITWISPTPAFETWVNNSGTLATDHAVFVEFEFSGINEFRVRTSLGQIVGKRQVKVRARLDEIGLRECGGAQ